VGARAQPSFSAEAKEGFRYIWKRRGLRGLLVYFAANNLFVGMVQVLITPMVLGFADARQLAMVLSMGGSGFLLGSLVMSAWGGPRRRVRGVLWLTAFQGAVLIVGGVATNVPLAAAAIGLFMFSTPIILGSSQAIWQSKVDLPLQGRVFAIRRMVAWSAIPVAQLFAGPLADRLFAPLLVEGTYWARALGSLFGIGPGRGVGLLFALLGLGVVLTTVVASRQSAIRQVEEELPDAVSESHAGPAAPRALRVG
jgi:MFS transporter, DHA3 family, macrolide efflux protein